MKNNNIRNKASNNPLTRALVVEDSEMNAIAVQYTLKHFNCQAEIAECGAVALTKLDQPYHFIIVDLGLPDTDGLQLSLTIRQQSACNATTPIVILTAHGDNKQKEQAREMGLNGFLIKPLTDEFCQEIINHFVLTEPDENYFLEN
jgi:DNA-binding response OmpR family regulator